MAIAEINDTPPIEEFWIFVKNNWEFPRQNAQMGIAQTSQNVLKFGISQSCVTSFENSQDNSQK